MRACPLTLASDSDALVLQIDVVSLDARQRLKSFLYGAHALLFSIGPVVVAGGGRKTCALAGHVDRELGLDGQIRVKVDSHGEGIRSRGMIR